MTPLDLNICQPTLDHRRISSRAPEIIQVLHKRESEIVSGLGWVANKERNSVELTRILRFRCLFTI